MKEDCRRNLMRLAHSKKKKKNETVLRHRNSIRLAASKFNGPRRCNFALDRCHATARHCTGPVSDAERARRALLCAKDQQGYPGRGRTEMRVLRDKSKFGFCVDSVGYEKGEPRDIMLFRLLFYLHTTNWSLRNEYAECVLWTPVEDYRGFLLFVCKWINFLSSQSGSLIWLKMEIPVGNLTFEYYRL